MIKTYLETKHTKLYNGDCIDIIKQLSNGSFSKVITSPPYNIIRPNAVDRGYDIYKDRLLNNEEYAKWITKLFNLFDEKMSENGCVLWNMSYGSENTECMPITINEILKKTNFTLADIIVWKKKCATPNNVSSNKMTRICEFVYVFCRRNEYQSFTTNKRIVGYRETGQALYENIFNYFIAENNDGSNELNKATFSEQFVDNLINRYILPNDTVLDCSSGTGTTMCACEAKQINSIGIELSKEQCEYAKNRIMADRQLKLL